MNVFRLLLAATGLVALTLSGCEDPSTVEKDKASNVKTEPHLQAEGPPSVFFDLKPLSATANPREFREYDCAYRAEGKTARFRIRLKQGRPQSVGEFFSVSWGEGQFVAVAGSENSALLQALKKALDATTIPENSTRVKELAFDAVVLGEKRSRHTDGSFSAKPAGDWMTIKLFLPKGSDEGEVYLNLNPTLGQGEFSIKDSDYGDYLLRELAKVL